MALNGTRARLTARQQAILDRRVGTWRADIEGDLMRHAGRELFMSVQPKGDPSQRKAFLIQLPKLMKELNEGMDLIGWPETAKKTCFGLLLPAHAQALTGEGLRTLDFNLLARQVDQLRGVQQSARTEHHQTAPPAQRRFANGAQQLRRGTFHHPVTALGQGLEVHAVDRAGQVLAHPLAGR